MTLLSKHFERSKSAIFLFKQETNLYVNEKDIHKNMDG